MPAYDFICPCGSVYTEVRRVDRRNEPSTCSVCGSLAVRQQVYHTMVSADYPPYVSPASGHLIQGKRQHLEDLRRTGCRLYEPGETEAFIKGKARREKEFDAAMDKIIDTAAAEIGFGG